MQAALPLTLLRWSAWTPGAASIDAWRALLRAPADDRPDHGQPVAPKVDFVPPLLRRRLSTLSRSALAVAADCLGGAAADSTPAQTHDCRTIFASPHGEVGRTVELLQQLATGEPLSPNGFSLSVHNTASGLYAIATGNRAASTALAAGRDTLPLAFIEAAGRLARDPAPLLLVFADEPLPAFYQRWQPPPARSFALALLLAPAGTNAAVPSKPQLQLQRDTAATDAATDPLALLPLLLGDRHSTPQGGERGGWRWALNGACPP